MPLIGSTIQSRYRLLKLLGSGYFGETYLAENQDLPDRPPCIVKRYIVPPECAGTPALIDKNFEIAVDIFYRLGQHPQIPSLLGKFDLDGEHYIAQEYVEGLHLEDEYKEGVVWTTPRVIDFLLDTLNTVDFIRQQNLIHQHLNPRNLIRQYGSGRIAIVGLGGVKDVNNVWQVETAPHKIVGDAEATNYMPYEQQNGFPQYNTDLYAIGIMAIRALTGDRLVPCDPESFELSWRDRTNANAQLVEIVDRLVRPDYRNRYQSAKEAIADLETLISQRGGRIVPPKPPWYTHPYAIMAGSVGIVTLGLAAVRSFSPPEKPPSLPTANLPPIAAPIANTIATRQQAGLFKIDRPRNWLVEETADRLQLNFPATNDAATPPRLAISTRQSAASLEAYTKEKLAQLPKEYANFQTIEVTPTQLDGKSAQLVAYTGKDKTNLDIRHLEIWTFHRNTIVRVAYQATPATYYKHLGSALTTIDSLKFSP
jgi:eukaryotic-like serine/threonine-protein kinase